MGDTGTESYSRPKVVPLLQDRGVINIVLGDYHQAALTSDGKLYSWGNHSLGALGLGDPRILPVGSPGGYESKQARKRAIEQGIFEPPPVSEPAEVHFDHNGERGRKFVLATAAAGWQTGALVLSLEVFASLPFFAF